MLKLILKRIKPDVRVSPGDPSAGNKIHWPGPSELTGGDTETDH